MRGDGCDGAIGGGAMDTCVVVDEKAFGRSLNLRGRARGGMTSSDELHDRADDVVVQTVGCFCICDLGLVAMELLRSGGCMRMWFF